jgi:hypothetical protein
MNRYPMPPSLPLAELRERYFALAVNETQPGAGSLLERYLSFEGFLQHGPWLAALQRAGWDTEPIASRCPGLIALALEAWPQARMSLSTD